MATVQRRHILQATGAGLALLACGQSVAHGSQLGDLTLDHPYAIPSAPGMLEGFAFLRQLRNSGRQADRLPVRGIVSPVIAGTAEHQIERRAVSDGIRVPRGGVVDSEVDVY